MSAPPAGRLRLLLAEDHLLVRSGIRALVQHLPGAEVVGEAGDGHQAVELAGRLRPDLVLMDVTMPGLNGIDATERIVRGVPGTRVLILSAHANEEYVAQALRVGASGYLLKDASVAELEIAIRAAAAGDVYLTPAISRQVVDDYVRRVSGEGEPVGVLTSRQREVLQLIAEGNTTKEIAGRLSLSVKTVESHRGELMRRLGLHDVQGLVRYAVRTGLVSAER